MGQKGDLSPFGDACSAVPLSPCALLAHPELAASRGFVSVRGLTRSSELPHKHKHQRAGVRVFS